MKRKNENGEFVHAHQPTSSSDPDMPFMQSNFEAFVRSSRENLRVPEDQVLFVRLPKHFRDVLELPAFTRWDES